LSISSGALKKPFRLILDFIPSLRLQNALTPCFSHPLLSLGKVAACFEGDIVPRRAPGRMAWRADFFEIPVSLSLSEVKERLLQAGKA
jgi:hypothetical protein